MGALLLFVTTFIWGTAFLAQKIGGEVMGPFALTCFRNILGGLFLLLCILIRDYRRNESSSAIFHFAFFAFHSLKAGVYCGVSLFVAMIAQQIGIQYTTPGIAGFLTTNYMFFIPIVCVVCFRKMPRWYVWAGVAVALVGSYLICMVNETMSIGKGEAWIIACAFLFAVQMLIVNHYARQSDVLVMSAVQLLTGAVLAAPFLLLPSELSQLHDFSLFTLRSSLPIVYLGVFSSGIAYTLQNFGQARTPPAVAGVILSMESVFAALSGFVVLGDRMSPAQLVGCGLVFVAAVFTQIFDIIFCKKSKPQS